MKERLQVILARLFGGLGVIIFGLSAFVYGISQVMQPTFVFPWGIGLLVSGIAVIVLGILVLFTSVSLKDVFEDIF